MANNDQDKDSLFAVLDKAADGAYAIDAEQRIVYWNDAAERMLGYSAREVLGRRCYEVIRGRDDDYKAWCRGDCLVVSTSRAGESPQTFDTCARTKTGKLRWINVSILTASTNAGQSDPIIVHLFRDASVAKQRERFATQILSAVRVLEQPATPPLPQQQAATPDSSLTERELEVLVLLARGFSTRDTAEMLSISFSTTRNHIQNVYNKLQVHSRAAAVAYAFEHGLVPETRD